MMLSTASFEVRETVADDGYPVLKAPANAKPLRDPSLVRPSTTMPISIPHVSPAQVLPTHVSPAQAKASLQWLTELALRRLPPRYEGDKDWGKQKEIWAGVKIRFDEGKLKTKRRKRSVKQGRWVKYEIEVPRSHPPNASGIRSTILSVKPLNAGSGMRIHSAIQVPMKFTARMQRWNLGLRLYSVTVEGRMEVELKSTSTLSISPDYSEIPPAIVANPEIESAELNLVRFEVDRVSRVGGDVAEAWGEVLQEVIVERFVEKQGDRIAEKLNRSIDKHRDDLKLSFADWIKPLAAD